MKDFFGGATLGRVKVTNLLYIYIYTKNWDISWGSTLTHPPGCNPGKGLVSWDSLS